MIIQIGKIDVNGVKSYQASLTDPETDYPTIDDCAPGSDMIIIDEVNKQVTDFKLFNGHIWAKV